jgi:hypothetical protein
MPSVRIEVHVAAFNEYRNSESVVAALEDIAHGIQGRAESAVTHRTRPDEPFRVETIHNATRAVTFVSTNTFDGELAEAAHRALSRAIG